MFSEPQQSSALHPLSVSTQPNGIRKRLDAIGAILRDLDKEVTGPSLVWRCPQTGDVVAFPITVIQTRLGRSADNDVILPVRSISRRHAVIELRGDGFYLSDLDSANGTRLNGVSVSEALLGDGVLIELGAFPVLFTRSPCFVP